MKHKRALLRTALSAVLGLSAVAYAPVGVAAADSGATFPAVISLPPGFQPEGIEIGPGATFYVGSLVDGSIYRGDVRTGEGAVLVQGTEGENAFGIERDRHNRLFVAGGFGGGAHVYDANTGAELASYDFGGGLVHDVVVTREAAYFTDTFQPVLYVVPIGRDGTLGDQASARTIPLSGDLRYHTEGPACPAAPELNATGIVASPDGETLIVMQTNTGTLFAVDAQTGVAQAVDTGSATLDCGVGLLRRGRTLYVAQPVGNQVSVLRLGSDYTSATLLRTISDPQLDFPTSLARFGRYLYTANARFSTETTPETAYQIVRLPATP